MSYRSDFTNLNVTGSGNYTTDCGWGCMIRSCQMMLSKALIERKKYNYWGKYIINLDIGNLKEIRKKILVFFLDNNVPIQNLISHNDYQFFWDEYSKLCLEDEKYTSLSEVIALDVPTILIPSPFVANNHQYINASDLIKNEAAIMIEEKDLKGDIIIEKIDEVINDDIRLHKIKENLKKLKVPDSALLIYNKLKEIIK